jgi:hypothetical protein
MKEIKLSESHKFSGQYKGIRFLISHHGMGEDYRPEGTWCYYLLINENQLPKEYRDDFILSPKFDDKGRVHHDYYASKIADLNWHCGITYYSKEGGADGEDIIVKIGCDYGHYWDEGHSYSKEYVLGDVKNTIGHLFEMFPEIKIRSCWYGGYFKPSEGEFNEHGSFMANEEKVRRDAEKADE